MALWRMHCVCVCATLISRLHLREAVGNENAAAFAFVLEHKTCDILAPELLRLMRFENQLIIDSLKVVCYSKDRKEKTSIF